MATSCGTKPRIEGASLIKMHIFYFRGKLPLYGAAQVRLFVNTRRFDVAGGPISGAKSRRKYPGGADLCCLDARADQLRLFMKEPVECNYVVGANQEKLRGNGHTRCLRRSALQHSPALLLDLTFYLPWDFAPVTELQKVHSIHPGGFDTPGHAKLDFSPSLGPARASCSPMSMPTRSVSH